LRAGRFGESSLDATTKYVELETDLIEALLEMIDTLKLDQVKLTVKLNLEIQRFKKLQAMFLEKKKTDSIELIDLKGYAKFILKEGTVLEQRSVLGCISSNVILEKKMVSLLGGVMIINEEHLDMARC